ncbi:cytochrome P450 [Haliea sp. E17]|uniref:cytochrome P450 n=1 Tax=Haliea sp. E17 TaxID=3401576 RepID=UPI003AAA217C
MTSITEMDLPLLPVERPEFQSDPMPFVEQARQQHPWLARFSQGYIVHGYQAVKDLAFMDDKLEMGLGHVVDFYQVQGTPWARFMLEMLQSHTGAEHARLRASVAQAFTPRRANQVRPVMRRVISELLDDWAPRGSFDFAEFASYFPIAVLLGVLGASTEGIPRIRNAIETHMASLTMDSACYPGFVDAYALLTDYVDELIAAREQAGAGDVNALLDALIATRNAGKLSDVELRDMVLVLLIAGYDTSKNMLTFTLYRLLERPGDWQRCAEDPEFCARVIEEMLRHSSIATVFRNVTQDFDYEGHTFPRGAMVAFAMPLANRDPQAFPDPLAFDPERRFENRHLAFGRGEHICLGQFLARAQLEEGLHLIAQRLLNPQRNGEISWRPFLGAWGLRSLPIQFDQAGPVRGAA